MKEARDLISYLQENAGDIPARDMYQGIEALQSYAEELDALAENLPPVDFSVTVKMEGTGVKFKDIGAFADFLSKRMNA